MLPKWKPNKKLFSLYGFNSGEVPHSGPFTLCQLSLAWHITPGVGTLSFNMAGMIDHNGTRIKCEKSLAGAEI